MNDVSQAIPKHLLADPIKDGPKPKNNMGKDDFMKLLMAQLQNQDPMRPMDHQEFSAQLAQFGSLEQLTNIGKGIENLQKGMGSDTKFSALTLIGKKIEAAGQEITLVEGNPVALNYESKDGLTPVKAVIYDEGGKSVREVSLNSVSADREIQWDGKDHEGKLLPSGRYTFRVHGVDKKGQAQELGTELSGRVTGVELDGEKPMLVVETASGKTRVEMAKVRNVMQDDQAKPVKDNAKTASVPMSASKVAPVKKDEEAEAPAVEKPAEPSAEAVESTPFNGSLDSLHGLSSILDLRS